MAHQRADSPFRLPNSLPRCAWRRPSPEIAGLQRHSNHTRHLVLDCVAAGEVGRRAGAVIPIRRLTESVGYRYAKVGQEFAHPAALIVLSPGGTVSRYLYGVEIDPRDLKLALIEASEGKIGESTAGNALLMYCFRYDPVGKKYMLYARNIMKAAGAVTLILLAGLLAVLWRRYGRTPGPPGKGE